MLKNLFTKKPKDKFSLENLKSERSKQRERAEESESAEKNRTHSRSTVLDDLGWCSQVSVRSACEGD